MPETINEKLKPCPFCGETPREQLLDGLGVFVWHVNNWCPIAAPVKFTIDVWNRREPPKNKEMQ
jgi:hypothetical protein